MKALWIENKQLSLRNGMEFEMPDDHVEVNVSLAGICGTDVELLRGYYDFAGVPGHEFVGEVTSPGQWQGKRVVADINIPCGDCEFCFKAEPHHCLNRTTLGIHQAGGAFAQRILVPQNNLFEVPLSVPDHHAVFAEPLAAAIQILNQVDLAHQTVVLVGAGRLGRMIAWVIHHLVPTADLTICVRSASRQAKLPQTARLLTSSELVQGYDVAIDCTGSPDGFSLAMGALKAMGRLVVKSTYADRLNIDMSRIVVDEITVVGSRCGSMPQAISFLQKYASTFENLTLEYCRLEEFNRAFEYAADSTIDKVLFQPNLV